MRFDSARAAGLDEDKVALIEDDHAQRLSARESAAIELTDALIQMPGPPDAATVARLRAQFSDEELVELAIGVSLFLGMSKVLICLGLEPEQMDTTVLPTPGSQAG